MSAQLITNTNRAICSHGWLHCDRLSTIQSNSLPKARTRRTTSIKLTLQTADEFFNHGVRLINQKLFAPAAEAFFSATQLQWTNTAAHIELGNAYSALTQYPEALEAYQHALETEENSLVAHYNIALTLTDLEQIDQALSRIGTIISINPKHQLSYTLLAKISLSSGEPKKAINQLLFAARLTKRSDPDLLVQAGLIYEQLQQTHRAARCYERALRSDPWHAGAFYNKALNQYNAGQLNLAYISVAFALHSKPKYAEALALLKQLRKKLKPKSPKRHKEKQTELFATEAAA